MGYEQIISTSILEAWYFFGIILVNMPVLTPGPSPGEYQSAPLSEILVGFITQFYLLRFQREWFDKVNFF
jgi:hypothetical protein